MPLLKTKTASMLRFTDDGKCSVAAQHLGKGTVFIVLTDEHGRQEMLFPLSGGDAVEFAEFILSNAVQTMVELKSVKAIGFFHTDEIFAKVAELRDAIYGELTGEEQLISIQDPNFVIEEAIKRLKERKVS